MESGCGDIESEPECICPCECGCQNGPSGHDIPFYRGSSEGPLDGTLVPVGAYGLCSSCAVGMHEIPHYKPDQLDRMADQHDDVSRQLREVAERRCLERNIEFSFMETLPMLYNTPLTRLARSEAVSPSMRRSS